MARQGQGKIHNNSKKKNGGGGGGEKHQGKNATAGGGGGCLTMLPIGCFAQPNNGKGMTMTPSPLNLEKQQHQHQGALDSIDDKENSNITAALEGIRAMQEVLSRNQIGDENEGSGDGDGDGDVNNLRIMGEPKRVLSNIDNMLSASQEDEGSPDVFSAGGSSTSTFTFKDSSASKASQRSLPSVNETNSTKTNLATTFDDVNVNVHGALAEDPLEMKAEGIGSSSLCSTPTPKDVSSMFDEAMGSKNQTPSKSPTQMLAHSLWIKEQQQQAAAGQKGLGLSSSVHSSPSHATAVTDAKKANAHSFVEKLKRVAPFAVGVALMTVFNLVVGGRQAKGKGKNQSWPTTYIKDVK